jgi:hypothetical protein
MTPARQRTHLEMPSPPRNASCRKQLRELVYVKYAIDLEAASHPAAVAHAVHNAFVARNGAND